MIVNIPPISPLPSKGTCRHQEGKLKILKSIGMFRLLKIQQCQILFEVNYRNAKFYLKYLQEC